ncbi:MAG: hypothetical protein JXQ72_13250 [Anaerolineae bacterium]|nr:hypothetical protein [Anaerolineae bacterium]
MFSPTNPKNEEIRAQAILSSLTDYEKAVEVFAPRNRRGEQICDEVETVELTAHAHRNNGRSIAGVFKAIKLNRRPVVDEPVQPPVRSPRQVITSG